MGKIPIILGGIIVICIMTLPVIDTTIEYISPTVEELACIEVDLPVGVLSIQDCAELLRLEKDVRRLKKTLKNLEKLINPGIDI